MKEPAARSVRRERRQSDGGLRALLDLQLGLRAAHVGLDPAGMGGIDLDVRITKLVRQVDRKGIQRRLRRAIRKRLSGVNRRISALNARSMIPGGWTD